MSSLAQYRKNAGLSQETIGKELGVPKTSVSAWENGRSIPTKHLRKLSKILNVTEAELLADEMPQSVSVIDKAIDAVMRSDLSPEVKVRVYEIIASVKDQEQEKKQAKATAPIEMPADFPKNKHIDIVQNPTATPRGKTACGLFDDQYQCPECGSIYYVSKLKAKRKHACPFCGKHIIVK